MAFLPFGWQENAFGGDREMTQLLKALAALVEDQNSVPSFQVRWFIISVTPAPLEPQAASLHGHLQAQIQTHTKAHKQVYFL